MSLIGFSGYAKVGKNTTATILQFIKANGDKHRLSELLNDDYESNKWWLEEQSEWEQKGFGDKLKEVASLLTGHPLEKFAQQEFKASTLGPEWNQSGMPITVREFLQKLGTDCLRDNLHSNAWVNALMADYKDAYQSENGLIQEQYGKHNVSIVPNPVLWNEYYPNWAITDVRFPNEAKAIKDKGGIIVRIERPGFGPVNDHFSETALDNYQFDYTINNDGDFEKLYESIKTFLKEIE